MLKKKTNLSLANNREIKIRVVLPDVPGYFETLSKFQETQELWSVANRI